MKRLFIYMSIVLFFTSCSQMSIEEKNSKRAVIDKMAETTIDTLIKEDASIKTALEEAKGYVVVNWKVTKVPVVGVGGGNGIVVDKRDDTRVYIKVGRFDIGGGWGARSYKNLIIINDDALLDDVKDGVIKFEGGAEVSAGTVSAEGGSTALNPKIQTHTLLDGGGSATATLRVLRARLDSDLN